MNEDDWQRSQVRDFSAAYQVKTSRRKKNPPRQNAGHRDDIEIAGKIERKDERLETGHRSECASDA